MHKSIMLDQNEKLHTWLITSDKEVLIKNNINFSHSLSISDFTLEAFTFSELEKLIEVNWGGFPHEDNFHTLERFDSHGGYTCTGYTLKLNLLKEEKQLIAERFNGQFIFFKEFINKLERKKLLDDFKESFYSLIAYKDK